MPSYAYSDDLQWEDVQITEDEILACEDPGELQAWWDDFESLRADIECQLSGYRAAGLNNLPWVYRACQKLGYLGRGQSRIRRRMKELGVDPNPLGTTVDKLNRKIQAYRAESGVAVEFMRLALKDLAAPRFKSLETAAVHALAERLKKEAEAA